MGKIAWFVLIVAVMISCKKEGGDEKQLKFTKPKVEGNLITFNEDTTASYFVTQSIESSDLQAEFSVPARVVATVMPSSENPSLNLILFDNPELTTDYTQLLQHLANIKQIEEVTIRQRTIELERVLDLQKHGAATGRDVLEAQTYLAMEK